MIVLSIIIFYFYRYGDKISPKNGSGVEGFLMGVMLSYLLATLSLLILHIVMHFKLLSSGKKYLIFGSSHAGAENIFFARVINFVFDLIFTKAYLILLLFAISFVDKRLCSKYWLWILLFNKYSNIRTNFGVVLIDLEYIVLLIALMNVFVSFFCWSNRHRVSGLDAAINILAFCFVIIAFFAGDAPSNIIKKYIHSTLLQNITTISSTLILGVLFAKAAISNMKHRMDL
ncbi:hypothetical protein [Caldicellulosiruptor morganii]|uniref:Uncharacterized protein n=1 Tax=Caldicellulosiruptor morganii TaxID=1387555 RepID=A0ABY7BM77_9FIRM|nr:hypothetical protein [Caldicellulosiruptor morganii]WAM33953.1 hypothetical protein OTK00_000095 [Caldicellulosiruptor morganii]